jgi:hypothetical protein
MRIPFASVRSFMLSGATFNWANAEIVVQSAIKRISGVLIIFSRLILLRFPGREKIFVLSRFPGKANGGLPVMK